MEEKYFGFNSDFWMKAFNVAFTLNYSDLNINFSIFFYSVCNKHILIPESDILGQNIQMQLIFRIYSNPQ